MGCVRADRSLVFGSWVWTRAHYCALRPSTIAMSRTVRVLIIEDEVKAAAYIRKGLAEHGFTADIANNGGRPLSSRELQLRFTHSRCHAP